MLHIEFERFFLFLLKAQVQTVAIEVKCFVIVLCVNNNCGNANLSGVKPVRRKVDQEQGSRSVFFQQRRLFFKL